VARSQATEVRSTLKRLLPNSLIEEVAQEAGAVQRRRRIGIAPLVWTLVLGFGAGRVRTLAGLRRAFEQSTGVTVVPSSFYDRFTPQLARLLRKLLMQVIERTCGQDAALNGVLAPFKDVLAADSTVIRLHDALQQAFKACRTNHTLAALKAHVVMSVCGKGPTRVKLTSERVHDGPVLRAGAWVEGRLLLFDLGYWRFQLFDNIDRQGGFFITRLKDRANPIITAAHRRWRGNQVELVGERLQSVLAKLQRTTLDVQVELCFSRRAYRDKRSRGRFRCRLIGVRNEEAGRYHLYLTNVPPETLEAEEVAYSYRARWLLELTFKQLKQNYRIDQLPTRRRHIVEALIYAALLTLVVSRHLQEWLLGRLRCGPERRIPFDRWAAVFSSVAHALLAIATRPPRHTLLDSRNVMRVMEREAIDPNRTRLLVLDPLVEGAPA
jgi:putative transposase